MKKAGKAPAPFLSKTHEIVEDHRTDDVISWTEDGAAFVIWKTLELARDLLPNHFKHNNFSSFVRQLNTYGFRKVTSERWEFTNQHFRRGKPNLLSRIQRKRNSSPYAALDPKSSAASPTSSRDQISSTANSSLSFHQSLLEPIHRENEALKKANEVLRLELAEVKQKNELLLGLLSNYMDDQATLRCNTNNVEGEEEGEKCPMLFGVCLRSTGSREGGE